MSNNEQYINEAVAQFEALLREQYARAEKMMNAPEAVDYAKLDKIVIGCCGGDGIGPIITAEARRVLEYLLKEAVASGKVELRDINGLTIENRIACSKAIPDDVLAEIKECHVLLKGPTTTPKGGTGAKELESANVAMRRELDLFVNVRPVAIPEEGVDWTFFRENTEGEYVLGSRGVEIPDYLCCDFKVTTDAGCERIARMAFDFAVKNGKTNVAVVTKANIMKKTDGKFARIARNIAAAEYPTLTVEDWYIDIMTAKLVDTRGRSDFQVFLLPNLYGDIITDEAAQLQGGVGTAGSANIGSRYAMFEAIHGSAPRMIERGDGDYANPSSMLRAAELLLKHIGFVDEAKKLGKALDICTAPDAELKITGRRDGASCKDFGDYVMKVCESL